MEQLFQLTTINSRKIKDPMLKTSPSEVGFLSNYFTKKVLEKKGRLDPIFSHLDFWQNKKL